jgi:hypothetical protein
MAKKRRPGRVPSIRSGPESTHRREAPKQSAVVDAGPGESGSRFEPVRRRARQAKLALVTVAVVVFGIGVAVTRASYAGHSKHPLRALAAPPGFVRVVRRNLLQAGIIAPAQAPAGAATAVS